VDIHRFVAWWCDPNLPLPAMFLVKLVAGTVRWRPDGFTLRGTRGRVVRVKICQHPSNAGHPSIGEMFTADAGDLIAVQYGYNHH